MPLYTKPGDAWKEPEHIRSQQPDGTMQEVEVVRAKIGDEYVDVWPEYEQAIHYLMLYDHGDECIEVTGGWKTYNHSSGYAGGTISNQSQMATDYMLFKVTVTAITSTAGLSGFITKKEIDISKYVRGVVIPTKGYLSMIPSTSVNPTYTVINGNPVSTGLGKFSKIKTGYIYVGFGCWIPAGVYTNNVYYLFLVQEDDWQTWLSKAGLSAASLAEVMSDSIALTTLLSSYAATQYMLLQCTGEVMASAIQSAAFKAALAASQYKDKVYANPHWAKFLAMV